MRKLKVFIVGLIAVFTAVSIVYLIYQAEKMERYTIARNDGRTCFLVYSSSGGRLKDGRTINEVLQYVERLSISAGYDSINLGVKKGTGDKELRNEIVEAMKQNKRYILLDINSSGVVINKNTVLIKLSTMAKDKYSENYEYVDEIKKGLQDKAVKVNIISDKKGLYNQDLGYRALYIDISGKNSFNEAKETLSRIIEVMVK